MKEPIISISGIRGILGESLYPENILKYATAFAQYTNYGRIVIGRDGRLFGDNIQELIESTLFFAGCEVINLDIAPTPTIALAVEALKADGGIVITASHNPQEWNGMKFINSKGIFLNSAENKKFLENAESTGERIPSLRKLKQIKYYPAFHDYHINKVLRIKSINLGKIRRRKFKVVLDCVNASGSFIIPKLLKKLGCKVVPVDCDGTGIFTRKPEPIPENIKKTCLAVKKNKADLGIVVDPDSDRLVLITEKGEPYGEEYTIVTAINTVLKNPVPGERTAVVNLSTSRAVDDIVEIHKGKLYRTPVGEINVIEKMKAVHAIIGGEGSGGVILPEVHYGRDSLVGIALVLNEFAGFKGKVSEYKKELPQYFILKIKIDSSGISSNKLFNELQLKYTEYPHNTEDGLRIDFEDSWVNFRKSNTEPIIRIITEAKTKNKA
ncbi:MAG: phosphoglucosamine mutase, partial [Ignavibacteria bacterium]